MYLESADSAARPLCRAHFKNECGNRRCKWSHALSLPGLESGLGPPTEPALDEYVAVPSLLWPSRKKRDDPSKAGRFRCASFKASPDCQIASYRGRWFWPYWTTSQQTLAPAAQPANSTETFAIAL